MSFSLGQLLANSAAPLADVVASHNYANAAAEDKRRQQAMQDIATKRQTAIDAQQAALSNAQIGNLNSEAGARSAAATRQQAEGDVLRQHLPIILNSETDDATRSQSIAAVTAALGDKAPAMLKDLMANGGKYSSTHVDPNTGKIYGITKQSTLEEIPFASQSPPPRTGPAQSPSLDQSAFATKPWSLNSSTDQATAGAPPQRTQFPPAPSRSVTPVPPSLVAQRPSFAPPRAPVLGSPEWQAAKRFEASLVPRDDKTLVQVSVDDGKGGKKSIYVPRSQAAGMDTPAKAGTAGALSGQTMQTLGRLGMSYNDLKQTLDQMDAYENKPGNLANQSIGKQMLGAGSEMHPKQDASGLMSGLGNMVAAGVAAGAQKKLGADDPEYRTYLANKQRVATAFTELLPRPNQQLLQLEKGLSGVDVGWNPDLLKNVQQRRRGGLDVLKNILDQQGMLDEQGNMTGKKGAATGAAHAGSPPPNYSGAKSPASSGPINLGTPSPLRAKYDDAAAHLAAQGKTPAQVRAVIGDPPQDEE